MKTNTTLARLGATTALLLPLVLGGALSEAVVSRLHLTKYTEPVFPASARLDGVPDGLVTLAIGRDAAGVPGDILVVDSTDHRFTEAALDAARTWRFAPTSPGTVPVAELVRIGFRATGVVFIAADKQNKAGLLADQVAKKLREPVRVPELQSLPTAPKALHQPMPAYPAALVDNGLAGRAEVRFFVDEEGRVRLPQVIEATTPEFGAAALAAVTEWRYEPPRLGKRRIVVSESWSFSFGVKK